MHNNSGILRSNSNVFAFAYRTVDLVALQVALLISLFFYGLSYSHDYFILSILATLTYIFIAESCSLYRSWRAGFFNQIVFYTLLSWGAAVIAVLTFLFFSKTSVVFSRTALAIWFLLGSIILVGWRFCFTLLLRRLRGIGYNTRSVAIIGMSDEGLRLAEQILQHPETGYRLKAIYDDRNPNRLDPASQYLLKGKIAEGVDSIKANNFDIVFVALPIAAKERMQYVLSQLGDTTANVHVIPDFFMYSLMHGSMSHVGEVQTISVHDSPMRGSNAMLKRIEDIVLSLAILAVIALPMLVIAIILKLTSPGPVFFKQDRYGLDGRKIKVWKFRSMQVTENSHEPGNLVQATKNDPRVTPFGAFLRKTSLDELPQFFNVLTGSMSVVGPRPHAVAHNEEYRTQVDKYMLRHMVKPGITGWAQVNGFRGETDTLEKMERRVDHDLEYIRNWSLFLDVKIVVFTLFNSFSDENAY